MVVAEQQAIREEPRPSRTARQQRVSWPKPSQLRQSVPILRLLAEIWAIPEVSKIGVQIDGPNVHLWIVMPAEDLDAEGRVYDAESQYLRTTGTLTFDLDVLLLDRMSEGMVPSFETILER